ncbi:MAG: hypothetical protein IPP45_18280 [Sphingomonadales bacterium]|nr:hypothetical protein [Sphingomonadales bacterium]
MDAPIFSKIELTGTLTTRYLRPIILLDDGTDWRAVGLPWSARRFIGQRIHAEGIRVGYRSIDVVKLRGMIGNRD